MKRDGLLFCMFEGSRGWPLVELCFNEAEGWPLDVVVCLNEGKEVLLLLLYACIKKKRIPPL